MPGTGLGLPNADTFANYGGALRDYPIGVSDPTLEESASLRNIYVANIAGMTHTIDRAMRSFMVPTSGQVGITDATGVAHDSVWGDAASVKAVGTFISGGTIDIIWPTLITDALGQVHQLKFQRARAAITGSNTNVGGNMYHASARVLTGNKIRVYTYLGSAGGSPTDLSGANQGVSVTVWVR